MLFCKVPALSALLLLSTLMAPCQGQADGSWKSCEEGLISIVGVDVPDKVSAGSDATFTLHAESGEVWLLVERRRAPAALVEAPQLLSSGLAAVAWRMVMPA